MLGIQEAVTKFNTIINRLLTEFERGGISNINSAEIRRIKNRVSVLRTTLGSAEPLRLAAPVFIDYREQILTRDEEFLAGVDVREEHAKKHKDDPASAKPKEEDNYAFELFDAVRQHYQQSTPQRKDELYSKVNDLLFCSLSYCAASM